MRCLQRDLPQKSSRRALRKFGRMERSRLMIGFKLLFSLVICQIAAVLGEMLTKEGMNGWYSQINKPFFTPPSWFFISVWSFLFVMMGLALFLITIQNEKYKKVVHAGTFFILQLVFNVLFSLVFFTFHFIFGGVLVLLILFALVFHTTRIFFHISELAGFLMVPYTIWIGFVFFLNLTILLLNR